MIGCLHKELFFCSNFDKEFYKSKSLILYRVFCLYLSYPQKSLNGMSFEFLELLILFMPVSTQRELDR